MNAHIRWMTYLIKNPSASISLHLQDWTSLLLSIVNDKQGIFIGDTLCISILMVMGTFTLWFDSVEQCAAFLQHRTWPTPERPCCKATVLTAKPLWQVAVYFKIAFWVVISLQSAATALNLQTTFCVAAALHSFNPSADVCYWSVIMAYSLLCPHHICSAARSLCSGQ